MGLLFLYLSLTTPLETIEIDPRRSGLHFLGTMAGQRTGAESQICPTAVGNLLGPKYRGFSILCSYTSRHYKIFVCFESASDYAHSIRFKIIGLLNMF